MGIAGESALGSAIDEVGVVIMRRSLGEQTPL
jgi:hypothetical protein